MCYTSSCGFTEWSSSILVDSRYLDYILGVCHQVGYVIYTDIPNVISLKDITAGDILYNIVSDGTILFSALNYIPGNGDGVASLMC